MVVKDGYRKVKYYIEKEIELNECMSSFEIDKYLEDIAKGREVRWCDADEELFN